MTFPDRKKPCLVVMRGNQCHVVGNFINTQSVEDFQKALEEMFGGEKENGNDENCRSFAD
jgi:hypothetical protein